MSDKTFLNGPFFEDRHRGLSAALDVWAKGNPAMVACWLAATKVGAVVVNTMPMLLAMEVGQIVDKADVTFALCDTRFDV